eukprot:CAMPEP_0176413886 /NCGR_PEP_ID=MMETSP0127-20121128/4946_1 /TAXON_ID=938130 /ORGANISM="Platyophrya macrostoma, Strain WH" /LENGTH=256 /DNA_ID=CAMNT_0017793713 /DNA_START=58 /DNA_END=828 /DNA_ORIENTATION=+
MSMSVRMLLLALVAMALFTSCAAQVDVDEENIDNAAVEDDSQDEVARDPNAIYGVFSRAFFDGQDVLLAPRFPAGEKAYATIGFSNDAKNPAYDVFFVSGFLTRLGDHLNHLQNFSFVRHERSVAAGETASFRYAFTPDAMLEPMDYNLVIRVYFRNDANNTFVAVAYNSTVSIDEPLGTDPKTILTFVTIAAIIGSVVYVVGARRKKSSYAPRVSRTQVESGTKDAYDPEYVSSEHLKFRETLLRKSSASPNKRK